jgi:SDR family mycofactocin-dependent oxidoreductase
MGHAQVDTITGGLMGKLDGRVAFITGAARGQGRAQAIRLAQEGADVIGVDICAQMDSVVYRMATEEDLHVTVERVAALGRRMVGLKADVRDYDGLKSAYEEGARALGPVTVVVANAGIGPSALLTPDVQWDDIVAVNMKGVWNTGRVAIAPMIDGGAGGSIVINSSVGALRGAGLNSAGVLAYTAAKHGVIGLMRSWANFLAPHFIRVNSVAPTTVATPMANMGDLSELKNIPAMARALENAMPVDFVEPEDVANAVAWLASDESRYVTGTIVPVDAGAVVKA